MARSSVTWIERELLESHTYDSLSNTSKIVLAKFFLKRQTKKIKGRNRCNTWPITNNGKIEFTYLEAEEKWGISKKRFAKALKELVRKGVIDVVYLGGAYQRDRSKFAISDRWKKYGRDDFEIIAWPEDTVQRGYRNPRKNTQRPKREPIHTSQKETLNGQNGDI